jgi:putative flippase GtrA
MHTPFQAGFLKMSKFGTSGIIATGTNISVLYLLTSKIGFWYITSTIFAFITAFIVSFTLQKYWVFGNRDNAVIYKHASSFFIVAIINLILNTFLMYICVEYIRLEYIASQVIVSGMIAYESYFLYRKIFAMQYKKLLIKNHLT